MAPRGAGLDIKHRVRRLHPYRAVATRAVTRAERESVAQVRVRQDAALRRVVRVAARTPFYREVFAANGIDPHSIRTREDLTRIPVTERSDLIERREDFRARPARLMWTARSSGTSGAPVAVYRTPGSSVYELVSQERQWRWFGLTADSRRVVLRGSDFAADQDGRPIRLSPGARQLMVSSFHLTEQHLPTILDAITRFAPEAVEGWPSSIAVLAGLLADRGLTVPVRGIITSSEVITGPMRAAFATAFDAPIIDHYGQTERVIMSGNCELGSHHVFEDYGIAELIPVGGDTQGRTDRWELVGTALHNNGFPLLRYRTGDEVGPPSATDCACGRPFRRIGDIAGRVEDVFTAADGRALPVPSTVIDELENLREAQIVQHAAGDFEVRVVPGPGFSIGRTQTEARRHMDRMFGPGQSLRVTVVDALPRQASGKLKSAYVIGV